MDPTWDEILNNILQDFGAQMGTIHWVNHEDNHLYLVAASKGIPAPVIAATTRTPVGKGVAGTTADTKKPVIMRDLQTDTTGVAKPGAKTTMVKGMVSVPVFLNEKVVGTLGIGYMQERDFSDTEVNRLLSAGKKIAAQLESEHKKQ